MIRFVIGLFVFAVALCAYIITTQHGGILPPSTPTPEQASVEVEVVPVTVTVPQDTPTILDDATTHIADALVTPDLGYPTADVPVGSAVRDTLAVLGLDITAGPPSPPDQRFARMIGEALKKGIPDAEIIQNINATARVSGLAIPVGLVQANGRIDTAIFLKAVLTTAVVVTENTDPVVPDLSNDPSAIISVSGYDYVITDTDSLASIAVKFYGDVMQTDRIVEANPIIFARPDQIVAGTMISIPAF